MLKLLSRWVMKRYLILWKKFEIKEFGFKEGASVLHKAFNDSSAITSLVFSNLRKAGWINVDLDPKDARKRVYSLNPYEDTFKKIVEKIEVKSHA